MQDKKWYKEDNALGDCNVIDGSDRASINDSGASRVIIIN